MRTAVLDGRAHQAKVQEAANKFGVMVARHHRAFGAGHPGVLTK
jgi:hypothetical protein